jgi:hypothetical protein
MIPTAEELKAMCDQLNRATAEYMINPTAGMDDAKLARAVIFAGIDLVFAEILVLKTRIRHLEGNQKS